MGQFVFLFYGALAFAALYTTWHDRDLRCIAFWLVLGWALSNALDWYAPIEWRLAGYSMIEFAVLFTTALAFFINRQNWPLIVLAAVNIFSIMANIGFGMNFPPEGRQVFRWEVTTNIFFAIECLIAGGVGIVDGRRIGRVFRLPRLGSGDLAPNAAREGRGP